MARIAARSLLLLCLGTGLTALAETTMERLTIHRDLSWAAHDRGTLDLYVPEGAEGAPVVLFVHGGALLFGDKSLVGHVGLRLAREGVVTVAVNHRFSPAVSHPEHVRDVAAATRWVVERIAEYGGDPSRIVLAGHSSGGYLAALLAVDPRWLAEVELDADRIAGLVSISGFHYVDRLAPSRPKHVWGEDPEAWVDASPAHRATA
ncbi:MAG: alpha/beta hydrolase, partial [Pseudomonadales bacterium]|nr:alpha/beta hydrolase [Pseudomonadales bacterium]